jgi:hypothetical protein
MSAEAASRGCRPVLDSADHRFIDGVIQASGLPTSSELVELRALLHLPQASNRSRAA